MKGLSVVFSGILASAALIVSPAFAQQMFPAGGSSSTSCPGGSSYKGSGYCRANNPGQQFFPAGGSGNTSCPGGSSYAGSGYCKTRWLLIEFALLRDPIAHWEHLTITWSQWLARQEVKRGWCSEGGWSILNSNDAKSVLSHPRDVRHGNDIHLIS